MLATLPQLSNRIHPAPMSNATANAQAIFSLVGRILLSTIFLLSGASKIMDWSGTADMMTQKGMVFVPFFLAAAIGFELAFGLSLLLGCKARLGGLMLFLYLIPVTLIFHNYWAFEGPEQKMQMINFLKNVAIMGGLLTVVAFGAGRISIDRGNC